MTRTIHAELKHTTEVIVTPTEIIIIEVRPPITADEVAMYGRREPQDPPPGPRILLVAGICAFAAIVGLAELYFWVTGRGF